MLANNLADYHNPQQQPGMDRKMLLILAVTFLVIIISQPLLKKYMPAPAQSPAQSQQKPVQASPAAAANPPAPQPVVASPTAGAKKAANEIETVVENDLYRITFTNRGAQVKSWILKKYDDDQGKPLDLVNREADRLGHPLSLWTYDETLRNKLNSALYVASAQGAQQAPAEISFDYADSDVSVRKTFRFDRTYVLHVETVVLNTRSQITAYPMWPAGFGDSTRASSYGSSQIEYQNDSKVERLAIKKISGGNTLLGPFAWAAVTDQYFAAVFIPDDTQSAAVVTLHSSLDIPK